MENEKVIRLSNIPDAGTEKLKYIAKGFSKRGLSPLEQFLCVYKYAAGYEYPEIGISHDYDRYGTNISTIVETGKATCLGAAKVVDTMLGELNIPSAVNIMAFFNNGWSPMRHANNIVKLQDDDYCISGVYGADACYDMGRPKFSHCLFPLHRTDALYQHNGDVVYAHEVENAYGNSFWEALEFSELHEVLEIPEIKNENYNFYQQGRNLDRYLRTARKNFNDITQCRGIKDDIIERALAEIENVGVIS